MAKINIILNNKNYSIDESTLSEAKSSLQSHLSTTMSGSGATINLGGTTYNIDSTKLTAATNDFVSHLGTISGSGSKVNVGGVEFPVDSTKLSSFISDMSNALNDLVSSGDSLAPGLYQPGAIALYNEGDVDAASAMLTTSWDDLVANGVIAISEGVTLPDDLVQNEYGFYYGMPYSATMEGMTAKFTFNEDGSAIFNVDGDIQEIPTGAIIFGDHSIDMTAMNMPVLMVSEDGTVLEAEGIAFSLEILDLPEMNEYGFYFGVFYSTTMEGMTVGFTFNEDGSAIMHQAGTDMEIPAGSVIYGDHSIDMSVIDGPVLEVSPDGTQVGADGLILTVGSSSVPPKGTVYLPNSALVEGDLVLPNDGSATIIPAGAFVEQTSLSGMLIPDSVTSIGIGAFHECTSLVSINIPNNITSIGPETFKYCSSLVRIVIGSSVTTIGNQAFYKCSSLTSVVIPDSVTTIGDYAFEYCRGLPSVTIPDSVTSIGREAFHYCDSLCVVHNNSDLLIEMGSTDNGYVAYYAEILVNNGETIYKYDRYNYTFTDDRFLFRERDSEYELISYLGGEVTVTLPENINGNSYNLSTVCGVVNVIIPESFTSINQSAFFNCYSLANVTIPNSVTSIGYSAFANCTNLANITIPDSVTYIGASAFDNTAYYNNENNWIDNVLYIGNRLIKVKNTISGEYIIKDDIVTIAGSAFYRCDNLTSVVIPDSVTSIGEYAFFYCKNLTSITIPDSVTSIGSDTFSGCTRLTSITIPDSVISIGSSAFDGCSSLTSVVIPAGVIAIESGTFRDCHSLNSVVFAEGSQLTTISSSNRVGSGSSHGVFSHCSNLKSISLPDTVTTIGSFAFDYCSTLRDINFEGTMEQWNAISFGSYWNRNVPATYIQCSDGQVAL